ncbi:hypothetical protein PFISCL1PPCAC_26641, partial [Pristionchus fissidentatus]
THAQSRVMAESVPPLIIPVSPHFRPPRSSRRISPCIAQPLAAVSREIGVVETGRSTMVLLIDTQRLKRFLLVGQSVVYLIAFASLYYQIPALYGENGVTPVAAKIEKCNPKDPLNCVSPLILVLSHHLSITPSSALQIVALLGIFFSICTIAIRATRNFAFYLVLVLLYLSVVKVGDTFLYFQWDSLLLESGWLMTVVAATTNSPADMMSTYLVRFLAARLMFSSGIVKLQSLCPTWWGLTALDIHFESQCLPTPLAWFAHNQPEWIRRLSVALTFFIEIYLPPMFLLPIPMLRSLAAIPNIVFMFAIAATGNYNFFNIHYALLCVACLEGGYTPSSIKSRGFVRRFIEFIVSIAVLGAAAAHWAMMFGVQYDPKTNTVLSKITFSKAEFEKMTKIGTNIFVHVAIIAFVLVFIQFAMTAYKSNSQPVAATPKSSKKNKGGKGEKKIEKTETKQEKQSGGGIFGPTGRHAIFVLLFGSFLFWTSFIPFTQIDAAASNKIPDVLRDVYKRTSAFEFTHSYGLFRRMTGEMGRQEIVLEGSHEPNGPWKEIEFFSKPGNVNTSPVFVAPHQPRLDWQMWFAALGAYQNQPWFLSFVNRLLQSDPDVIGQLKNWPFKNKKEPLRFIRAQLYHYRFTKPGSKHNFTNISEPSNWIAFRAWWTRSLQSEYMPVMTKDTPAILERLAANSLVATKTYKNGPVDEALHKLHKQAQQLPQTTFVWSTTAFGVLLSLFL